MRALVLVFALVAGSGCLFGGRPNPQIKKLERKQDGTGAVSFSYDDAGYVTKVKNDQGGETSTDLALTWKDGLLTKVVRTQHIGAAVTESTITIEHDDDKRIANATQEADAAETKYALSYDDDGRLVELATDQESNGNTITRSEKFSYGDDGALTKSEREEKFGDAEATKSSTTYASEDGHVTKITAERAGEKTVTSAKYDDDARLTTLAIADVSETAFEYGDDDRIASMVTEQGDSKIEVAFEYGDADAQGLLVAPDALAGFWDVNGRGYTAGDDRGVARLLGLSW